MLSVSKRAAAGVSTVASSPVAIGEVAVDEEIGDRVKCSRNKPRSASPPAESATTAAAEDATYERVDGSSFGLHQLSVGFARDVIFPRPPAKSVLF
jgi:hypothetical protein